MIAPGTATWWPGHLDSRTWLSLGSIAQLMLLAAVVLHCLKNRREATSTILWVAVAWSFPLVGPLLFLSFGVNRVPIKGSRKEESNRRLLGERAARETPARPLAAWRDMRASLVREPSGRVAQEVNRLLDRALPESPLLGGNRIAPLVTGDQAFPRMMAAIESASHHIHLQTFILGNDPTGRQFMEALRSKAEAGVTVRLLFDRFGSTHAWLGGLIARYSRTPHMKVVGWTQANPIKRQFQINLRNHRKTLIVDGRTAFTGGINLHAENTTRIGRAAIRDYHFSIDGPLVQELQYAFLRDWFFMTDEEPEGLLCGEHFPCLPPAGSALARLVSAGPTSEVEVLGDTLVAAIGSAERELLAVTPYLVPTADILRAFRVAALRGVRVRLVVPLKNNHPYAGMAGRALYDDLLSAGVRIFERPPPFIHAKALIVDDAVAIVGTANLDVRSLRLNYETNVAVFDDGFIGELKRIVLEDLAVSRELNANQWRARPAVQLIMENACNLLTPIL